jgi:tRNA nucleotidyltransferase (CCA-adding enzyme)
MTRVAHLPFVRALHQAGGRVYMVGGTLRDALLGREHKDLDLLVTGLPQNILIRLLRQHGRVQLIGRAFGVIKFLPRQWSDPPIDIALPRTEVSTGIGHRDFAVTFDHTLPIETDLERRDFTINSMALDLADERLIDPFGGYQDLQRHRLRQVSPTAFPEDPLRMLRGVQFAARFGLHVEPRTHQAMCTHAAAITTVAAERIAEELRKLFQAPAPSHGFYLMHAVGLLSHLFPELARLTTCPDRQAMPKANTEALEQTAFARTMRRLDAVQQHEELMHRGDLNLLLAALWSDSGQPEVAAIAPPQQVVTHAAVFAQQRLETLRMTMIGAQPALVATLIAASAFEVSALTADAALRHLAHRLGCRETFMVLDLRLADRLGNRPEQSLDDLLALRQRLHAVIDRQVPLQLKELAVNGHDLQHLGIPPGPRLGQVLETLLHQVLDDPTRNTREYLLAAAQAEYNAAP